VRRRTRIAAGLAVSFVAGSAQAGTYYSTADCTIALGCDPGRPATDQTVIINRNGIVYPASFSPIGGTSSNVKVCVESAFGTHLDEAVAWAVEKWNALVPKTENCLRCTRNEDADPYTGPYSLATTVLHELGHCARALDHTTLIIGDEWLPPVPPPPRKYSSWTVSYDGARIGLNDGVDNIRGSKDDMQLAGGGGVAVNVFWFRISDNNPVATDATPIDITTFSYDQLLLSGGAGTWPANANRWVTTDPLGIGAPETVAVMSDLQGMTEVMFDLTADDVNMVKMSRTGIDRVIGGGDDNTIGIELVSCAGSWDVKVLAGTPTITGALGECASGVDFVFPLDPHHSAQAYKLLSGVNLTINNAQNWDFGIPLFWNGFESETTNHWSSVSP